METYNRSVLEYDDVALAVDYAEEKGEKRGERRNMEKIIRNGYRLGMSLKQLAAITDLTEEQIAAILNEK
ncbi:MAG: hypothetical protein LBF89_03565 [Bacteroidales bacterium]|jgi:hypothetical protein|nr:hypothetical protein [Bacteroidales bacterium]